ncbi:hypothetical protein O0I10_012119 [Lichtheimia ornata]|uniref:PH domain-containing protein n=1 Tax=Lichtheimia ornata TaxID=688661 RepID=A0AAD7URL2_9FUNG|nr:uncharacterized protein O0I10_012119 [Lichtheimia ornata]KAJ8652263.1 hypothetical protein O0I10_012119 [Lichtheimia ornata]
MPHNYSTSTLSQDYQGWLLVSKLRKQLLWRRTPQRFYCILDGQQLYYYDNDENPLNQTPCGIIDVTRYQIVANSPSQRRLVFNKLPTTRTFQLLSRQADLPDLVLVAESVQAKDDWITYLSNNHQHNTLDKWLERLKLHNDTPTTNVIISPSPSSSSSSDAKVSPTSPITATHQPPPSPSFSSFSDNNNSHSTPLANVFHTLVARRKSAAVLQNHQRRRLSFVSPSLIAPAASQTSTNSSKTTMA